MVDLTPFWEGLLAPVLTPLMANALFSCRALERKFDKKGDILLSSKLN